MTTEDEDDDIDSLERKLREEEARNKRIEELAKKIMDEKKNLAKIEKGEAKTREEINKDLDTLSERSEDEGEVEVKAKQQIRRKRTRSASRDRSLAKIRYCWRCHQTGHENFDCRAELHPGTWCPRCLDTSHWEDGCWVNEQQVQRDGQMLDADTIFTPTFYID